MPVTRNDIKEWAKQKYPTCSFASAIYTAKQEIKLGITGMPCNEWQLWSLIEEMEVYEAFANPVYEDSIIALYLADVLGRSYDAVMWQKAHIFQTAELHRNQWAKILNEQVTK